jgi:phytoene desaturase
VADVVLVGGGVGGLAAAIRLRALGHDVVVLERNPELGGKLAVLRRDGFTFELGPSLLTLPHVIDECFATAGARLEEEVDLVRLDPQFRYHWTDGSTLDVHDDAGATAASLEAFSPGSGDEWRRFDARARRIWDVSERTFLAGPMQGAGLLRRMRSPADLGAIDPLRTLAGAARRAFHDPRLRQWLWRYATYSGSSALHAPATLSCIPAIESTYGCWYPMGGMGALRDAFVRVAARSGVELRTGVDVARIDASTERVTGVTTSEGEVIPAGVVVADVDAAHLYGDLLPDAAAVRRVARAGRSTSAVVVLVAADGTTPGLAHHNVWFSADGRTELAALDAGRVAGDPTIYACVSAVTERSQAPEGAENWSLLVNVPSLPRRVPRAYVHTVLGGLRRRGIDLPGRARWMEVITPADLEARDRSPGGAIYGTSSNGRRAAFLRPGNRGPRRGLYLVGGSTHPGGGLPLVTISARIVADLVTADGW